MSTVRHEIEMDANLLERVEEMAKSEGISSDQVITDAISNAVQHDLVEEALPLVEARGNHDGEQNQALAQAQAEVAQIERDVRAIN